MQVLGSSVSLVYAAVSEPAWERGLPVVPPPVIHTETQAFSDRPVGRVEAGEWSSDRRPYSAPVRVLLGGGLARRALAVYESVQRLEQREDLPLFAGVDVYA